MHIGSAELIVAATAALVAVRYAAWESGYRRFGVAPAALALAVLVILGIVPPAISYGMLCVVAASAFLANLLAEERARTRRVASLAPRPAADLTPTVWIVSAAASVLLLTPYVMVGEQRVGALLVGICALVMAAIAWRIASAPVQLGGTDFHVERTRDRALRSRRAGLTAVVAAGSIFVFISLVSADVLVALPLQRILLLTSLGLCAALGAWVAWYVHQLERVADSTSS